jgi:TPR repeat protein
MRIHHLIIAALFIGATSLHAGQVITQDTLDQTLLNAQSSIQEQNYSEAFALYSQAAQWGHKGAQYVLGELYLHGKGVARDPVTGYAWLQVAAEAPDREFIKARNAAGKKLSDSEKQEAGPKKSPRLTAWKLPALSAKRKNAWALTSSP